MPLNVHFCFSYIMLFWGFAPFICIANYARSSFRSCASPAAQSPASPTCFIYCQLQTSAVVILLSLALYFAPSPVNSALQFNYFSFSCFVFFNRLSGNYNNNCNSSDESKLTCMQQSPPPTPQPSI